MPEIRVNVTEEVAQALEARARAHGLEVTEFAARALAREAGVSTPGSVPPPRAGASWSDEELGSSDIAAQQQDSNQQFLDRRTPNPQNPSLQEHFDSGWSSLTSDEVFDADWDKES